MSKKYSFEKIDYLLRPKKQIERKIFIDILNKIQNISIVNLSDYYYIGMGSISYYDFILFHKFLNIKKMISIDNSTLKRRFEFNKPYNFVEFYNKKSTDFLSDYKNDSNFILWLDYDFGIYDENDKQFRSLIEDDISLVVDKAIGKDFFLITIDIKLNKTNDLEEAEEYRRNIFHSIDQYISPQYKHIKFIKQESFARIVQDVIINIIEEKIKNKKNLDFYKLFAFTYNDSTPMFTIGGVFDENNLLQEKMKKEKFVSTDETIIDIDVPILTYREKLYLDQKIEKNFLDGKILKKDIKKITKNIVFDLEDMETNINNYFKYYRYYPQYFEGII
ncbi:MAG: hypothetical protein NTZ27_09470 [Ignavibacteriales bacterium]|nr:hypothetical protein [Ignavibacteriales bacterium]